MNDENKLTRDKALELAKKILVEQKGLIHEDFRGKDQFRRPGNECKNCCKIRLDRNEHFADFYREGAAKDNNWEDFVKSVTQKEGSPWGKYQYTMKSASQNTEKSASQITRTSESDYPDTKEKVEQWCKDFCDLFDQYDEYIKNNNQSPCSP